MPTSVTASSEEESPFLERTSERTSEPTMDPMHSYSASTSYDPENTYLFEKQSQQATKKRSRTQFTDGSKIDCIYNSIDAVKAIKTLLRKLLSVTRINSKDAPPSVSLTLPVLFEECLNVCVDELERHGSMISAACANTQAKKRADLAHCKRNKARNKQLAHLQLMKHGVNQTLPPPGPTWEFNHNVPKLLTPLLIDCCIWEYHLVYAF